MRVIGVTGGVGAGKSTVLSYMKEHYSCRLLLADEIAHEVMEPGGKCYEDLRKLFPEQVFDSEGRIDRPKMAEVIFANDALRGQMNALVHPAVGEVFREEIAREKALGIHDYCLLEAALFADTENDRLCDEIWYVQTSTECRRERLKRDRSYSEEKIASIMEAQKSEEVFLQKADRVIVNNQDFADTVEQIEEALLGGTFGGY